MPVVGATCVIDLYHADEVTDWDRLKSAGIVAVIHKATEALHFTDSAYLKRKAIAKAKGFLWGSYHYASGDDPVAQANHYLDFAKPGADELICLDCERSSQPKHGPHVPDMTYDQLVAFVGQVQARAHRLPFVYGGANFLSGLMKGKAPSPVNQCPLWFAEYPGGNATAPQVPLPDGWKDWILWQYAADGAGPEPRTVDGVVACDRDTFHGTVDQLNAAWPFT